MTGITAFLSLGMRDWFIVLSFWLLYSPIVKPEYVGVPIPIYIIIIVVFMYLALYFDEDYEKQVEGSNL